jgi:type IV pilus assembly protein PilC
MMEASGLARAQGGYLRSIKPLPGAADILQQLRNYRVEPAPGLKDVMHFTKQLAVMVKAGINIRDAVGSIAEQVKTQRFRKILLQIKEEVEAGVPFSEALAKHPKVFNSLYINMVRASEISGTFAYMLERVAKSLAQQVETRNQVRGAMIYPCVLLVMSITAVVFLLTFVLPRFLKIFAGKEHLLPTPTKMVLAMSNFMQHQWFVPVGLVLAALLGVLMLGKTESGRYLLDRFKLRVPILQRMFRAVCISRSLQTMGELIRAGVPMLETLEITGEVSGNVLYRDMWLDVRNSVKGGDKIAKPLAKSNRLPRSVVQMIAAGEDSGNLGEMLEDVADFYAKELKETIKSVTSLIEPLMIVIMGVVVGFIAMSIIFPVFKMSSLVKG